MTTNTVVDNKVFEQVITDLLTIQKQFFGVNEVVYKNIGVALSRIIDSKKLLA